LTEAMDDPQVKHLGIIVESDHPTAGRTVTTRPPASFSQTPTEFRSHSPGRSEHTAEILGELGFDTAAVDRLRDEGVIL
jgi:crotonobetainyl-CoA:carnitine CoA-transferase CaiB-like acyl-CoA transferase